MSIVDMIKSLVFGASAGSGESVSLIQHEQAQSSKSDSNNGVLAAMNEQAVNAVIESSNAASNGSVSNLLAERVQLTQELSDALKLIVSKHGKTLDIKMRQMSYQDAYGNYIFDKFFDERDYFIKNVMCRDVDPEAINFLFSPEEYSAASIRLFNEGFNNYSRTNVPQLAQANFDGIDPVEYEHYCAALLETVGWNARITKASGDQGVDIIATFESIKVVGQCKLYSNPVGNAAVQEIIGGREYERADYAFVVSNSSFTSAARALASSSNVLLLHHSELSDLHNKFNISLHDNGKSSVTIDEINDQQVGCISRPLVEIIKDTISLIARFDAKGFGPNPEAWEMAGADPLYDQAVDIVVKSRRASISLVQRNLRIGYNRAARLVEQMEAAGIVTAMQSNGNREVIAPQRQE